MEDTVAVHTKTYPCCSARKLKIIISFISAVCIPLMLAIFTVVFSIQQDSIAKANRQSDLQIAADQHRQNQELALEEHRHDGLMRYYQDIANILLNNQFVLNRNILQTIVRPKTLAILRELDPERKSSLFRFLQESRLISKANPPALNLIDADFNNIRIESQGFQSDFRFGPFSGVFMENASFSLISFSNSDFSGSRLRRSVFDSVNFEYVTFFKSYFQETQLKTCSFYKADLTSGNFTGAQFLNTNISRAGSISNMIFPNGTIGRNPNLLHANACEALLENQSFVQTISVQSFREWISRIDRKIPLYYLFTADFDHNDDVNGMFAEWSINNSQVVKHCRPRRLTNDSSIDSKNCSIIGPWLLADDKKTIREKFPCQNETATITIEIKAEKTVRCRDLYFSLETI